MSTRREPPKKIFLQVPDDCEDYEDAAKGEVTWSTPREEGEAADTTRHRVRIEILGRSEYEQPLRHALFQSPDPADIRRALDVFYAGDVRWSRALEDGKLCRECGGTGMADEPEPTDVL